MNPFTLSLISHLMTQFTTSPLVLTMLQSPPQDYRSVLQRQEFAHIVGAWPQGTLSVDPRVIANILAVQAAIRAGEYP